MTLAVNAAMADVVHRPGSGFDWRVQTGTWRWLILGALGAVPLGCGGRTSSLGSDSTGTNLEGGAGGGGGSGTTAPTTPAPYGGTSSGGVAGTGMSEGGTGGGTHPLDGTSRCEPPFEDLGGGWQRCSSGMIHRTSLGSCTSRLPRAERVAARPTDYDAGYQGQCEYDADCTAAPYGHCELSDYDNTTYCDYGCLTNADCDPGYACLCGDPVGSCHPAACEIDSQCGGGLLCSDFTSNPGCGGRAFACQTLDDTCAAEIDCPEHQFCSRPTPYVGSSFELSAPRSCVSPGCVIGRPFLVAGQERLAPEASRSDWYCAARCDGGAGSLDPELRAAISRGWLEQALMEHASVAAFARFSLQLLALGAPAELVSSAASAMNDEIEHARACFELARRHRDDDVGPGPLSMDSALEGTDLESVMLGTIAEGCIGETIAAIEAAEAAAHCEDGAARGVLERIAADETRHAELAWRFVAWALESGPAALRERARVAFSSELQRASAGGAPSGLDRELARHGLIAPALRGELRQRVLSEVIAPCARALLEGAPPPRVRVGASAPRPLV